MDTNPTLSGAISICNTPQSNAGMLLAWLEDRIHGALADHGSFDIAISGGSAPKPLFELFARHARDPHLAFDRWHLFFADERYVPVTDTSSNFHLARELFLTVVPIHLGEVYPYNTAIPIDDAAKEYEETIKAHAHTVDTTTPKLDCIILGLGPDGHTASLFPETTALNVADHLIVPNTAAFPPFERLTMTYPLLNAAANVVFLVTGADKGQPLADTVRGNTPAAKVQPVDGHLFWFLDQAAYDAMERILDAQSEVHEKSPDALD